MNACQVGKVKLWIPDFPNVFEAYLVGVNADKTPNSENLRSNYSEYFQLACRILLTKIQNIMKSNIWTNMLIMSISDDVGSYMRIRLPSSWRCYISSEQAKICWKVLDSFLHEVSSLLTMFPALVR